MKEIHTYADAIRLGNQYIPPDAAPIEGQFFQMTREALYTTLSYIFQFLHHNCYLACVADNKLDCIVKLASKTTAPIVKKALAAAVRNLSKNKTITDAQRLSIAKNIKTGQWRVMNCIVKRYKEAALEAETDFLYERALRSAEPLPNGVFVLSLTDAAILRHDGMYPFTSVAREKCPSQYLPPHAHLPLFCLSGQRGYADIPLPTYDDLDIAMDESTTPKFETRWTHKRGCAVFRGGPTGCGTAPDSNQRLHLAELDDPPKLDVGIALNNKKAKPGSVIQSNSIRFDPVHGLSMINTTLKYKSVVPIQDQAKYKYIIHVDGNALAYRLLPMLRTGSLMLRVESPYVSWADRDLRAFEHYVPVRADLSDLYTKLKWCEENDTECRHIAANGRAYAENALTQEVVFRTIRDAMWDAIPAEVGADIASISLTADLTAGRPAGTTEKTRCAPMFRTTRIAGKLICRGVGASAGGGASGGSGARTKRRAAARTKRRVNKPK